MLVVNGIENVESFYKNSIVSLGNFDGVHIGHQKIISELVEQAYQNQKKSIIVTFDPHPKEILYPETRHLYLTTKKQKLNFFEKMGVNATIVMNFSEPFSKTEPIVFFRDILFKKLNFDELIVGQNHAFGREKKGSIDLIAEISLKLGFKARFVEPVRIGNEIVSSSLIRNKIASGKLGEARIMLGRVHGLLGKVIHGKQLGLKIGFPTANLNYDSIVLPPNGVYVVEVKRKGRKYLGVANIGSRPTFEGQRDCAELEVHIIDFSEKIYEEIIEIEFIRKIRDEIKFEDANALSLQIKKDIEDARINYVRYLKEMC